MLTRVHVTLLIVLLYIMKHLRLLQYLFWETFVKPLCKTHFGLRSRSTLKASGQQVTQQQGSDISQQLPPNKHEQRCDLTDYANRQIVFLLTQILCGLSKVKEWPFQDELDNLLHQPSNNSSWGQQLIVRHLVWRRVNMHVGIHTLLGEGKTSYTATHHVTVFVDCCWRSHVYILQIHLGVFQATITESA